MRHATITPERFARYGYPSQEGASYVVISDDGWAEIVYPNRREKVALVPLEVFERAVKEANDPEPKPAKPPQPHPKAKPKPKDGPDIEFGYVAPAKRFAPAPKSPANKVVEAVKEIAKKKTAAKKSYKGYKSSR